MTKDHDGLGRQAVVASDIQGSSPPATSAEEEAVADLDEPPEPLYTPPPAPLSLQHSSFTKYKPTFDCKPSLLTSALKPASTTSSPIDDQSDKSPSHGLSCVSVWSTPAELTSDGGCTSPGTRTSTPSPPLPSGMFHSIAPIFNNSNKSSELPVSIRVRDEEVLGSVSNAPLAVNPENTVEAVLGRKRCIMFACGQKEQKNTSEPPKKPSAPALQSEEPPKRTCTIKFACPTKISTDGPTKNATPRARFVSPAPPARRKSPSPRLPPKVHRDSNATVRNHSPVSARKVPTVDQTHHSSGNSDLARCEAYRFYEFASAEEEIEEWTQEVTCHRSRLTVQDTLKIENNLRKLGQEVADEEALEEDDEDDEDEDDAADLDDEDDELLTEDDGDSDAYSDETDEGFRTDDEEGFAVSDGESDAGSDYNWWTPGASTVATSVEHLERLRLQKAQRAVSESSIGSLESREGHLKISDAPPKRRKSRPVNIRVPSTELPDSTDFVCGTLDEDRPAEAIYMAALERRRAAKHKPTPQDIDPTFPTSDPELPDDEDEASEVEHGTGEGEVLHGRMDPVDCDGRGRRKDLHKKRSPLPSPRRFRSPATAKRAVYRSPAPTRRAVHRSPAPVKRAAHRSPPPRKLFGTSPKQQQSPPPMRLRSPPPTRRSSLTPMAVRQRSAMSIRFGGLAERPALTVSASVPRTPITMRNPFDLDEDDTNADDMPIRRAIDIQVGLEKKRQRRRERLYRKQHCKGAKEKRPAPGRGAERMREMGLAAHAHKGKTTAFGPFRIASAAEQQDMHVLSV